MTPTASVSDGFDIEPLRFHVSVRNTGTRTWNAAVEHLALSYHLSADDQHLNKFENPRFALPDVGPGQVTRLDIPVPQELKAASGKFILTFDIVREGVAWFAAANPKNGSPHASIVISPASLAALREKPALQKAKSLSVGIVDIDLATSLAFYTVRASAAAMPTTLGNLTVLTAGTAYPQAWIRDCATGVSAALVVLDRAAAKGCILLHLLHQHEDGYVNDWIDATRRFDKNTVETDQESSLVIAASDYVRDAGDTPFLRKRVGGLSVIRRLEMALDYVWAKRRDPVTGLVVSGHTIDWGDVSIDADDHKATDLSGNSHLVAGIYTNAMYILALRAYLGLPASAVDTTQRANWHKRLQVICDTVRKELWNAPKGYFVEHHHVTPLDLPFDEDAMFPMGGNAVAIAAGIATREQADRIIANALRLQNQYHAATISGTLYPPYPGGTYRHPMVSPEFHYQNGGLWDWFGLRLVRAMLQSGHAAEGCAALRQIAAKVVRNRTFSEWDDLNGTPEGSRNYLGAAGQYIAAVRDLRAHVMQRRRSSPISSAGDLCGAPDATMN